MTGYHETDSKVAVDALDRATGTTRTLIADVLVGADGIHSVARTGIAPPEDAARYAGRMLWRATTRAPSFLTGATMIMAGHQDQKFVCYPITPPGADGRQTINWIAELPVRGESGRRRTGRGSSTHRRFRDAFADLAVRLARRAPAHRRREEIYEYPLADRDPLATWGDGRVTLLGDAAHPMYPIGSNGASQAILDAAALADGDRGDAADRVAALRAYQTERREPTGRIILANRGNGPEQVMQLAETRAPDGFEDIEAVIPRAELEEIAARYKVLAGFSPQQVNRRSPRLRRAADAPQTRASRARSSRRIRRRRPRARRAPRRPRAASGPRSASSERRPGRLDERGDGGDQHQVVLVAAVSELQGPFFRCTVRIAVIIVPIRAAPARGVARPSASSPAADGLGERPPRSRCAAPGESHRVEPGGDAVDAGAAEPAEELLGAVADEESTDDGACGKASDLHRAS